MKKVRKMPQQSPSTTKKYFNPYDDGSKRVHTYRKKTETTPTRKAKRRPVSIDSKRPVAKGQRKKTARPYANNVSPHTKPRLAQSKKLTKKQHLRLKRKRQLAAIIRLLLMMSVTVGLVWGVFLLKDYLTKTRISTQLVQVGSLDTSTHLEGVVLRSEKVVYGQETGTAQYVVAEGEKVKKDGKVYVLVDQQKVDATTDQMQEIESQIYSKAENSVDTATNQDIRYNLAQEVKGYFQEYYNSCFESKTSYIYTLRSKLDSNVSSRTDLYVAQQQTKDDTLASEKLKLDETLSKYQTGVLAKESGIISFHMDGNETEDVSAALDKFTYNQYNKLKKVVSTTQLGQNTLTKDSPIYKIVLNNNWYVISYVPAKEDNYVQGESYELYFDDQADKPIAFSLLKKKEEGDKVQLVFKTSNQIGDFLSARGVGFSIGEKNVTGLKIPVSAIVEQNFIKIPMSQTVTEQGVIGVYRKKGEVTEFVTLDIQSTDKENKCYYVLQDLTDPQKVKLNDIVVNKENGSTYQLTESVVKQGVYVVNSKIASFKEVEILSRSNEYAIVRYNNNSQLKEMDKIISNPKSVKKDQLLDQLKIENE